MDSVNRAFGAQIFTAMDMSPSLRDSRERESGSGFSTTLDFRAYMQDSFQGFDLRLNDLGEGQLSAQLRLSREDFSKHFKFISRKMASVYDLSTPNTVQFALMENTPDTIGRTKVLNLSKMAIRAKEFGVPTQALNIGFEHSEQEFFIIQFLFTEN